MEWEKAQSSMKLKEFQNHQKNTSLLTKENKSNTNGKKQNTETATARFNLFDFFPLSMRNKQNQTKSNYTVDFLGIPIRRQPQDSTSRLNPNTHASCTNIDTNSNIANNYNNRAEVITGNHPVLELVNNKDEPVIAKIV